jgi:glutathione S-transferase
MSHSTLARLITIPQSHYCEKARWALDRVGLPYVEEAHITFFHAVASWRAGGRRSTPVLVHAGRTYPDSTDILLHLDQLFPGSLYPHAPSARAECLAVEHELDERFGPHTRRWAYHSLLPLGREAAEVMAIGVPSYQRLALPLLFDAIVLSIRLALRITPASAARSLERVRRTFASLSDRLRDGRRYLLGDRFTAADLTFAALAAPVLFPPGYARLPPFERAPAAMRAEVEALRATLAGRLGLRLYAEERQARA